MFKRIYIEITNDCNLSCDFCKKDTRSIKYLSLDEFKLIISKIKDHTKYVYFHIKGEPFLHKNLFEFIDICSSNNLFVNITTNGRFIEKNIDKLNNIRQINISLQSYSNLDEVNRLLNVLKNIKNINISLRIWNNSIKLKTLLEDFYNMKIDRNKMKLKDNIFVDIDDLFIWPDLNNKEYSSNNTCLGLIQQIGILVDGTIVPCCLDQDGIINLGNIFKEDLNDVLNKEKVINIISNFKKNKLVEPLCKRCGYIAKIN